MKPVLRLERTGGELERETGFEPATPTLARLCSTTELFPLAAEKDIGGLEGCQGRLDLPGFESIREQGESPSSLTTVHGQHIEPAGTRVGSASQIEPCQPHELALFCLRNRKACTTKSAARARLYLDETEGVTVESNQVDFAKCKANVALDDRVSPALEPLSSVTLGRRAPTRCVDLILKVVEGGQALLSLPSGSVASILENDSRLDELVADLICPCEVSGFAGLTPLGDQPVDLFIGQAPSPRSRASKTLGRAPPGPDRLATEPPRPGLGHPWLAGRHRSPCLPP